jgi:hypothetical protein
VKKRKMCRQGYSCSDKIDILEDLRIKIGLLGFVFFFSKVSRDVDNVQNPWEFFCWSRCTFRGPSPFYWCNDACASSTFIYVLHFQVANNELLVHVIFHRLIGSYNNWWPLHEHLPSNTRH